MTKLVTAYLSTALVFLVLDGSFLALAGAKLYLPEIGVLLTHQLRPAPALIFYLIYIAGLIYFAVWPGLKEGWVKALAAGAILGLVAYGTYDLTNNTVMKVWSTKVTVIDMAWGAFASGAACVAGVLLTQLVRRDRA